MYEHAHLKSEIDVDGMAEKIRSSLMMRASEVLMPEALERYKLADLRS